MQDPPMGLDVSWCSSSLGFSLLLHCADLSPVGPPHGLQKHHISVTFFVTRFIRIGSLTHFLSFLSLQFLTANHIAYPQMSQIKRCSLFKIIHSDFKPVSETHMWSRGMHANNWNKLSRSRFDTKLSSIMTLRATTSSTSYSASKVNHSG